MLGAADRLVDIFRACGVAGVQNDLVALFDQKLGGHFAQAVGRTGDEDARHSKPFLRSRRYKVQERSFPDGDGCNSSERGSRRSTTGARSTASRLRPTSTPSIRSPPTTRTPPPPLPPEAGRPPADRQSR